MRLELGVRLGRYEVVASIGAGGMGEVSKALKLAPFPGWGTTPLW